MSSTYDKGFYAYIPLYMQNELDALIKQYGGEEWFAKAYENYKTLCLYFNLSSIERPGAFFERERLAAQNLYANDEVGVTFSEDDVEDALYSVKEEETDEEDLELDFDETEENKEIL